MLPDASVLFESLAPFGRPLRALLPVTFALALCACGPGTVPVGPSPYKPPATTPYVRYVAFGDSLTAGVVSLLNLDLQWLPDVSYPSKLTELLAGVYDGSPPQVFNAGKLGEWAADGRVRLAAVLAAQRPQVVLLMEGTNDINALGDDGIEPTLTALSAMVDQVQAAGAIPVIATLPPETVGGYRSDGAETIPRFNTRLRALAARRGLILADVFSDMENIPSLIGPDGLHLTGRGYIRVAQSFLTAAFQLPGNSTPLALPGAGAAPFVPMLRATPAIDLGQRPQ